MTDEVRQTRSDALKDAIAEAILTGELAPGQRLDEVSVAQRFAVSRTPVREALKQLAAMELIELRPHRGAVVAGLDQAGRDGVIEVAQRRVLPRRRESIEDAPADVASSCPSDAAAVESESGGVGRQALRSGAKQSSPEF